MHEKKSDLRFDLQKTQSVKSAMRVFESLAFWATNELRNEFDM
jgi:hypothetical protein